MTSPHRISAAFLELSTPGGVVMRRWQSRWVHQAVTWEGLEWVYRPFDWTAVASGGLIDMAAATIGLPLLPSLLADLRLASDGLWIGRLRVYQYPETADGSQPPAGQVLVGGPFRGRVVLSAITATRLEMTLDSGLVAVGSRGFPPGIATTALIGTPCQLGGN